MKHCPYCGLDITPSKPRHCPKCKAFAADDWVFCTNCGTEIDGQAPNEAPKQRTKSKQGGQSNNEPDGRSRRQRESTISALLTPAQTKWIEQEAKRSKMTPRRYLGDLIAEAINTDLHPVEAQGDEEQLDIGLSVENKATLRSKCKQARISMASAIRGWVELEMNEVEAGR